MQWSKGITHDMVSDANPAGMLTNLDLEMTEVLLHEAVFEAYIGQAMQGSQITTGCDNSPAVP
jgi:hypothetical protein